jgi:hypothetical protein
VTFSANRRNGIREIGAVVTPTRQNGPKHRNAIETDARLRNDAGTMAGDSGGVKGEVKRARGAVIIAGVSAVCLVGALLHQVLTPVDAVMGWAFRGFIVLVGTPYVIVGAVVAIRTPRNRIGTLLQVMGLAFALVGVLGEYGMHGLVYRPGSLPGAIAAAWVVQWAWTVVFGLSMFVLLLFPNGRFLSRRWRRFSYFAAISIAFAASGFATATGVMDSFTIRPTFLNPLGVTGMTLDTAGMMMMPWLVSFIASSISLFIRFRQSSGVERLQLKWLAVGAIFTAVAFTFPLAIPAYPILGQGLTSIGIVLLPTTIGIAILRYRLYDIDVLINRALVYGLLTVALAAAYIGLVFAFQALLEPFTAESDLAIAASTLGVAALFRPARARMQDFIDRRFYRRKFDAEQTVAQFSARLRDEVELSALTSRLTDVVQETMEPRHVSLWMREVVER